MSDKGDQPRRTLADIIQVQLPQIYFPQNKPKFTLRERKTSLERFFSERRNHCNRVTMLQDKLTEKRTEIDTQFTDPESLSRKELDPKVVEMYEGQAKDYLFTHMDGTKTPESVLSMRRK